MHEGNPFLSKSKHCAACLHDTKPTWPCSLLHKQSPVADVRASLLSPGVKRLRAAPSGSWRTRMVMTHGLGEGSEPNDDNTAGRDKPTAGSALTGERLTTTPQSRAPDGHLGKAPTLGLEG